MYREMTHDVEVTVSPRYMEDQSEPERHSYLWAYRVTIANHSQSVVQLLSRHWRITDAKGIVNEVEGDGVVGEQPVLSPGDSYQYTSGCPLTTPSGMMGGHYRMAFASGETRAIAIPTFSLDIPGSARTLN